jgi:hypothetical protein
MGVFHVATSRMRALFGFVWDFNGFHIFLEIFGVFCFRFSRFSIFQRPDVPGERKRIEAEGAAGSPVQG